MNKQRFIGTRDIIAPSLSLFLSAGTLICCALPALFITLGLGATLAGFIGEFPQIVWLSEYKAVIFTVAGLMLILAGFMQYKARYLPCPADPLQAKACARIRKSGFLIYVFSVVAFLTGAFFAFIAPYILV